MVITATKEKRVFDAAPQPKAGKMRPKGDAHPIGVLRRLELYFSVRHILRAMRQFAELFEHDYDLVMIFLSVVEAGLQAVFHHAAVNAQEIDIDAVYDTLGTAGLSIMSIGESTSIPRETVRRKVRRLIDMGYLSVSDKDKSIYIPKSAINDPKILEILTYHVKDVGSLVKTISFYSRDHHEA